MIVLEKTFTTMGAAMLRCDSSPDSVKWRVHQSFIQYGRHPAVHGPGVAGLGRGMLGQVEDEHHAVPYSRAVQFFGYPNLRSGERRFATVGGPDGFLELFDG